MIKDDRIYQVLLKYNFDLFRGDKNITEYIPVHVQIKPNDVRGYRLKAISDFLPEDIQTVSKMAIRGKTGYIPVEAEVMEQIDRALIRQLNLIRAARNMVMEELSDGSENEEH